MSHPRGATCYHLIASRKLITDTELIESVLAGEAGDYAELIRRHHARVHGLCASLVGVSAADDAAQEIFLKAYDRLKDYRGDCAFSTWLYRVSSNHCLDLLRKETRRRCESLEALTEREGPRIERLFAEDDGAERSREDCDLVRRVLAELPEDYRLILTLREMEGLEYKELMGALDCSMDSVKAKLRRARRRFRDVLRHILPLENVSGSRKS